MEINIKLSTTDIENMLGKIYGFKDGSVKVSINGEEIIATASENQNSHSFISFFSFFILMYPFLTLL